jgi:hypothetical protein
MGEFCRPFPANPPGSDSQAIGAQLERKQDCARGRGRGTFVSRLAVD